MAKCRECGQRKGKRACPALGSLICPVCCGTHRGREIACPASCRFPAEHKPYQDRRTLDRKSSAPAPAGSRDDLLRDERLAWLAIHIEAPIRELAERDPRFTDGDAILALEYAKDKLTRGRGRLILPGEDRKPSNAAGEAVFQILETCRYNRAVILVGAAEGYTAEEKLRVLDRVIQAAKSWTGGEFGGRTYLERLREQFARLQDMSRPSKIIAPA
jgi:hypothetical protein